MAGDPGVLLDLDGTLIDSNYLHTLAWCRALRELGERATSNAVHRLVGMGGDQLVPQLLGHDVAGASDARARHFQPLLAEVQVLPGATELVRSLRAHGVTVVLATSAPEAELDISIRGLGGRESFDAVTSADDVERSKPAPDLFEVALRAGGVDARRAIAVGDSIWDVQAARAAGLPCLGVETGGFSRHELSEAGALYVYRDVEEIAAQLLTGPIGALARS